MTARDERGDAGTARRFRPESGKSPGARALVPANFAVVMVAGLLSGAAIAAAAGVPGAGGVRIDGTLIPPERVWSAYRLEQGSRNIIHARQTGAVDEQVLERVIERAISSELMVREAARRGHRLPAGEAAEIRKAEVERWRGEQNLRTMLKMLKVEEHELLEREQRRRLIDLMAAADAGAEKQATPAAVEEHYRLNIRDYRDPAQPPLRYVFVPGGARPLRESAAAILTEAVELKKERKSFAPLVSKWSRHESAKGGGVVPDISKDVPGLPLQPKKLGECKYTLGLPVDNAGLHLYFRDCKQPYPLERIREQVRAELLKEQRRLWLEDLLKGLRVSAKIEYLDGAYPAESPDQPGSAPHQSGSGSR